MGQSTDAMLVYGYHLGGGDSGWELEGLGEYGELPDLPWYGPEGDFQAAAERHLLATLAGFTETWEPGKASTQPAPTRARPAVRVSDPARLLSRCLRATFADHRRARAAVSPSPWP
ncbi:hypothetical protein ACH4GK_32010 [Streptomyces rimosus]|uniref:hypothetical protein n=1 Tax=Streptomyces rimosus TaxID=1927 RepID=UPI0004C4AE95|nr:hypothetical protein [Streptomyces rimosus]